MRVRPLAARRAPGWRLGRLSLFLISTRPARPPPLRPSRHWPPARGAPPRDQRAGRDRRGQELGRGLAVRLPGPPSVPTGAGRGLPAGRARCGSWSPGLRLKDPEGCGHLFLYTEHRRFQRELPSQDGFSGMNPKEASKPVFPPYCGTYGPLGFGSKYYLSLGNYVEDYSF